MKNQTDYRGELFLDRLFKDLYKSKEVLNGNTNPSQKEENIRRYMERLESLHTRVKASPRENDINLLKRLYYDKYVIKEENIPESYYIHQQEIMLERGYGHVDITSEMKKELSNQIIEEQKKSLDYWLDYFLSDDTNMYPMWVKYWAFQGMLKLGSYNKETNSFSRRTKGTTASFIELNQEALALSIDTLLKYLNKEEINDKDLEKIIESGVFGKIYAYELSYLDRVRKEIANTNAGVWIKYPQGTDHMKLVKSLEGKGTGWCTAGETTAKDQLRDGDFYVYYSFDSNNEPTIPRIAIRMEDDAIAEIRGVAENQNIEPDMESIIDKKLEEFPDKDEYKQKVEDMKKLTQIYKEYKVRELTIEELSFLYEIDDDIKGFGYQRDPRIDEILMARNEIIDVETIFSGCKNKKNSNIADLWEKNIFCFMGDLDLSYYSNLDLPFLPKYVYGDLNLGDLRIIDNILLPKCVYGDLNLSSLAWAEDLKLPEKIDGSLYLNSLKKVEFDFILPKQINGSLYLNSLISLEGLQLPKGIKGDLDLSSLQSAKGLVLPEEISGYLYLNSLTNVEGLVLPKIIYGSLDLSNLTSVEGLVLPEEIFGTLYLDSLTNVEELILPKDFECSEIRTAHGYIYPEDFYKYQKQDTKEENQSKRK